MSEKKTPSFARKAMGVEPHDSAHLHVTGASEFVDDRPAMQGEVFVTVLFSPIAKGTITKLDASEARKDPDFIAFYTAADLHANRWGTIFQDQPLLAEKSVEFAGEPIAVIVTPDRRSGERVRKKIKLEIKPDKAIRSIGEARAAGSFIAGTREISRDFSESHFSRPELEKVEGTLVIEGADHFYLESQATIAYPLEDGQIEVVMSSQHPTECQHVIAHALGLPDRDVTVMVKRMGGGFGGKESQAAPFAAFAALAAKKLNRPARIILTKDDDMIMTGKRNPFEIEYRVAFTKTGVIEAMDAFLYSDGGAYADLSTSIMERAMLHSDNAYYIPKMRVRGQVCRTNYHPHTAFRGFGGPKGVALIERVIEEIGHRLGIDPLEIRRKNLYRDEGVKNVTHYGQVVENNVLSRCLEDAAKASNYESRRKEIEKANRRAMENGEATLRGLSLTLVKFGISFTTRFLNQGNAFVICHRDGTFQVSTGATEMGQGVNARIAELLAEEFSLPRSDFRLMPTRTDKNANTSPTAASTGTDLNGAAALLAARKIKHRLAEFASKLLLLPEKNRPSQTAGLGTEPEIPIGPAPFSNDPNEAVETFGVEFRDGVVFLKNAPEKRISFPALVNEAYLSRISLSDYAHYRIPGIEFNKLTGKGRAFLYYTQGAAASEVRIDRFTGEVKVDRVDIHMDLGRLIHAGLDLGQVSGAFIQGMGWVTTEHLFYSKDGLLLSHSPSTYKIPNIQDTPRTFNLNLIENLANDANVRGTKAVGEPPLLLALSVWTSVQDALKGLPPYADRKRFPKISIPATQERVLRAIDPDAFAKFEAKVPNGKEAPFVL